MKLLHVTLAALALPVALTAQQPQLPANLAANPMIAVFYGRTMGVQRNLAQAFDSIPESKFSYKPTPSQQSIGFIAQHLVSDNYLFCNNFGAAKGTREAADTTTADSVKATWPKAKLISELKASFAFCESAFSQLTDANLAEMVSLQFGRGPARQVPRVAVVLGHAMDIADHYSQIANYMRLNNMVPPTALPRPARPPG